MLPHSWPFYFLSNAWQKHLFRWPDYQPSFPAQLSWIRSSYRFSIYLLIKKVSSNNKNLGNVRARRRDNWSMASYDSWVVSTSMRVRILFLVDLAYQICSKIFKNVQTSRLSEPTNVEQKQLNINKFLESSNTQFYIDLILGTVLPHTKQVDIDATSFWLRAMHGIMLDFWEFAATFPWQFPRPFLNLFLTKLATCSEAFPDKFCDSLKHFPTNFATWWDPFLSEFVTLSGPSPDQRSDFWEPSPDQIRELSLTFFAISGDSVFGQASRCSLHFSSGVGALLGDLCGMFGETFECICFSHFRDI